MESVQEKIPKIIFSFPVGKMDRKGNLNTKDLGLKNLFLKTHKIRIRNRPKKEDFEELKTLKLLLLNLRKQLCGNRNSEPRDTKLLEAAIKEFKKDKSRDPNGWINDIFMEGIAGNDLKLHLLILFNRIKFEN